MDPGWNPTAGCLSGLIVIGTVNMWCTKAVGYLSIYIVVQHWLLATDYDCVAVGLLLTVHLCSKINFLALIADLYIVNRTEKLQCSEQCILSE